ncbi:hypothetical protein [Paenibacillus donghaensis]|uniref:Major facilitator superfamily (MFS) profile domain-containing protein n=1 Tax=Paenibacillus donghaensis TaxID=414771 RepID=A0A2Z2KW10_9BACL|nr:hypothetical protein [Paenibacillus donghaensis]ASA25561.1 hypothetical protein B9T62_35420 [Paenibacillus donghaensis]
MDESGGAFFVGILKKNNRLPRKTILITADLLRVPVALAYLWVDGADKLWLLYTAGFLLAAGEAIYSPVRKSSIPLLARGEFLLRINGMEQLLTGCVLILGAFAGGVVSMWLGPDTAFIVNALSFVAGACLLQGITFPGAGGRCGIRGDCSLALRLCSITEPKGRCGHRSFEVSLTLVSSLVPALFRFRRALIARR